MKAKTELLLYRLHWLAEKPFMPTFRNLTQSFEGWAYANGLLRQIQRLEAQGLLEAWRDPRSGKRLHRLTEAGRLAASGGRDPEALWEANWDGKWRLFLFDIPVIENPKRHQLTRALAAARCGCLQGSVWISPAAAPPLEALISEKDPDCSHLLLLLADSKGAAVDRKMVAAAWDFDLINQRWRDLGEVLGRFRDVARQGTWEALAAWTAAQKEACRAVLQVDPLLPAALLPKGYLGRKTWRRHRAVYARAARIATMPAEPETAGGSGEGESQG